MNDIYNDFYFIVYDKRNKVVATFQRRWQAEKFTEEYTKQEYRVERIDI